MALEFLHRGHAGSRSIALFPGTWNPPTIAHLEIARAALKWADEVVWLMPQSFPHKKFEGLDFGARARMITELAASEPAFSAGLTRGGLFVEMVAEARATLEAHVKLSLVCGRDAAERAATWNYGRAGVFEEFIRNCRLLVADREGSYAPPAQHTEGIVRLDLDKDLSGISSTEVRNRIAGGASWEHLVPAVILPVVRSMYFKLKANDGKTGT